MTEVFLAVIVGEAPRKIIYQFSDLKTYVVITRQSTDVTQRDTRGGYAHLVLESSFSKYRH